MIRRVFVHELRVLRSDRTLPLLGLALLLLVGYALFNGQRWVQNQASTVERIQAEDLARMETLRTTLQEMEAGVRTAPSAFQDPSLPAPVGRSLGVRAAVLPPAPLAVTSVGQSDLFPSYALVTSASADPMARTPAVENPLHLLGGRFDLSFVVVFLLPLLILGVGYGMLSQEREDGTLPLLLTQPLPVGALVAGKLLARGVVVAGGLILFTLVGLLLVGVSPTAPGAASAFLLWSGIVLAYSAVWLLLAGLVNLLRRSSAENAMILATAWLFLAIVIPAALNITATLLYPVPSRAEMIVVERGSAQEAQSEGSRILAAYYEEHPELAGETPNMENFAAQSWAVQEEVERRVAPIRAMYDQQAEAQRGLLRRLRFLSPALVAQEALQDVAGTGEARYRDFRNTVAELHVGFRDFIGAKIVRGERFTSDAVDRIPSAPPVEAGLAPGVSARVGKNLLGLLAPALLLVVLVMGRMERFREGARG
jgi:ABC-2 type transport system permease protein